MFVLLMYVDAERPYDQPSQLAADLQHEVGISVPIHVATYEFGSMFSKKILNLEDLVSDIKAKWQLRL